MAFSIETKRVIRQRDGHSIHDPQRLWDYTECSHHDHDKKSDLYDHASNGHVCDRPHHYTEHLLGVDKDFRWNEESAKLVWDRMTPDEQAYWLAVNDIS